MRVRLRQLNPFGPPPLTEAERVAVVRGWADAHVHAAKVGQAIAHAPPSPENDAIRQRLHETRMQLARGNPYIDEAIERLKTEGKWERDWPPNATMLVRSHLQAEGALGLAPLVWVLIAGVLIAGAFLVLREGRRLADSLVLVVQEPASAVWGGAVIIGIILIWWAASGGFR